MTPANLLKQAREFSGLSVRNLAEAADVSASTVHRIEQGKMQPTVEMLQRLLESAGQSLFVSARSDYASAVVGLAAEIRSDVASGDETSVVRKCAEFVARFRSADAGRQHRMLWGEPASTGDVRWDAFVAALAEWLAVSSHIAVPGWVHDRSRRLAQPWWVSPMKSMEAWEYAGSPAAFQSRGVFIHRDSLVNV